MKPKVKQMQLLEGWTWGAPVELRRVSMQEHLTSAQENKGCISLEGGSDLHCASNFISLETHKHWEPVVKIFNTIDN